MQDIVSLGKKGEVKNVSDGYAINFLLPQNKVVSATKHNIAQFEAKLNRREVKVKEKQNIYKKISQTLNKQTVSFSGKVSDKETLFQGIGVNNIIQAVKANFNLDINEKWFRDSAVIKKIGRHEIILNLPDNKTISFYINIKAEDN